MAEAKTLAASVRDGVGKGAARQCRREGRLPAVIYGGGDAPTPIALSWHDVNKLIYAGGFMTTTFDLEVDGKVERVIARDYQLDPLKGRPIHVDFLRLKAGQKIAVEIPVHAIGQENATAIKNGGVVDLARHAVELTVPADAIPDHIDVDVTDMAIGDVIHIADLKLPRGARLANEADAAFTVLTMQPPTVEPEVEEEALAPTDVEVVGEGAETGSEPPADDAKDS